MASPDDKSLALKAKTDLVRRTFNYPDTEVVIQDYACSLKRMILIPGRIYITTNYVSFMPVIGESIESVSFRKVNDIKKDSTIFLSTAITFETTGQNISFGSFMHRDEAFNLIYHFWKFPPIIYESNSVDDEHMRQFNKQISGSGGNNSSGSGLFTTSSRSSGSFGNSSQGSGGYNNSPGSGTTSGSGQYYGGGGGNRVSGGSNNGGVQQQTQYTKVDTESTRQALRIALETRETGISTMHEMSHQAEMIDQIEYNVENIHGNLDKSERLLKGIESFGGAISNAMSKEKVPDRQPYQSVDRSLKVRPRDEPSVEIDILEKLPNDYVQPAFIQISNDKFVILDSNRKPTPTGMYAYDQVEFLVVRARHFHLDIRFLDKSRFRFASSYIQNIITEIVLRANGKVGRSPKVIFEPGVTPFAYGDPTIRFVPSGGSRQQPLFGRPSHLGVSNFAKNAPDEVRNALIEQDKDLDEISALLGDIHGIAKTIGYEADRQSEQLDRVTTRVDYANDRLKSNNQRIQKML
ncbi:hypothetical protein SAMD00019534_076210, partial [Acytostelium subglobosum LB1]|uniref:hypothetical protein n=1 Tax=Acytostelium subglobosum LB1 TaxID=1410327 RepID=UPI000644D66B